jgi:hypothetical protein
MAKYSLGNAFTNWRDSDLPVLEKARLTAKNNLIKLRTGKGCCGNHGEPGC